MSDGTIAEQVDVFDTGFTEQIGPVLSDVFADSNADATGDIPFPTVLVVDANRTVRFADVHVDSTTRTEVPTILEAVDRL